MSYGRQDCYASCPISTVTIQPPPFILNIPGPALYCPDQPFQIEQYNPCAYGGISGGARPALYSAAPSSSRFSSFSYRDALPCSSYSCSSYKSYCS